MKWSMHINSLQNKKKGNDTAPSELRPTPLLAKVIYSNQNPKWVGGTLDGVIALF